MNATVGLTVLRLIVVLSASPLFAQSIGQPGQLASPIESSALDQDRGIAPIRLSPDGVSASNSLMPVAHVEDRSDRRSSTIWKISMAAMLGATAMDAASSMGKQESNPLLRSSDGTFGARGIAIKSSLAALCIAPQLLLRSRHELRKPLTIANFIGTGLFTFAAIHNQGVRQSSH
jgi:hypothetical protein